VNLTVVSKTTKCRDFPRFFSKMHRDFADFLPRFSYSPNNRANRATKPPITSANVGRTKNVSRHTVVSNKCVGPRTEGLKRTLAAFVAGAGPGRVSWSVQQREERINVRKRRRTYTIVVDDDWSQP